MLYVHVCVFTLTAKLSLLIGLTAVCAHTLVPSQHVERTELLKYKRKLKPFEQVWAGLVLLISYSTSTCLYHPFDILYWCVFVCVLGALSHTNVDKIARFFKHRVLVFPQPDSSFPPLLLVFFSWRRTGHTHITHSRGPPI